MRTIYIHNLHRVQCTNTYFATVLVMQYDNQERDYPYLIIMAMVVHSPASQLTFSLVFNNIMHKQYRVLIKSISNISSYPYTLVLFITATIGTPSSIRACIPTALKNCEQNILFNLDKSSRYSEIRTQKLVNKIFPQKCILMCRTF